MPCKESEDNRRAYIELFLIRTLTADGLVRHDQFSTAKEFVKFLIQSSSPSSDQQQALLPKDSNTLKTLQLQTVICICRCLLTLDKHPSL